MPTIPLHYFTPQQTGDANVRVNPHMHDGEFEGVQRIAGAVAGIGQTVGNFAMKAQEAKNYATMADAERQMKEGFLLFQDEMDQEGDETKWGKAWEARAAGIEKGLGTDKLPPVVRDALAVKLADWKSEAGLRIQQQARKRGILRARDQVIGAAESDLKLGDVEGYKLKIKGAEERGLIDPAQAGELVRDGERKASWYSAMGEINVDPAGMLKNLDARTDDGRPVHYPALDEGQRYSLRQSAMGALNGRRTQAQTTIAERRFNGEVIEEAEVMQMVNEGLVSPSWAKGFLKAQLKEEGSGKAYAPRFAEVLGKIRRYDPKQDSNEEGYAQLFEEAQLLPDKMSTDAVSKLKAKLDKKAPTNSPAAKFGLDMIDSLFKGGAYGVDGADVKDLTGAALTAYNEAVVAKAEDEDALMQFIEENPQATRTEVTQFFSKHQGRRILRSVRSAISTAPAADEAALLDDILSRDDN